MKQHLPPKCLCQCARLYRGMSLKVSGMETVQLQLLVSMFQLTSSILFLKGQVYEAMDNRGLAADCYKQALQCDVHCYEAFEALVQHQMLSAQEGNMTIRNKN